MFVRSAIAGWLERGTLAPLLTPLAWVHGHVAARGVARPLNVPAGIRVVTVGGATLGGSGKTRVALAATKLLADAGARVTLIGHGYRSRGEARVVRPDDALEVVGDEALVCARALEGSANVVSGPNRQAAVDLAVRSGPQILVIDGPLQLAPVRASLALLAVDASQPWGAGALPPAGDLRAPRAALLAHADHVVAVSALPRGAWRGGELTPLGSLARGSRLGLFTAIARPQRLVGSLRQTGITFTDVVHAPDHGPFSSSLAKRMATAPVDLWLATAKCAVHLERGNTSEIAVLDGKYDLPEAVRDALLYAVFTKNERGPGDRS